MNQWAIVTGASSGIGAAIAEKLAEKSYSILLCGRNSDKLLQHAQYLEKKYKIHTETAIADISTTEGMSFLKDKIAALPSVKILVNNAGVGVWGTFSETSWDIQQAMFRLNNQALMEITHFTIPLILKSGGGYIQNVASTAAFQAVPGMAVYSATKIFVIQFSRALATELLPFGIKVSCLCPGATETAFVERAGMKGSHLEKQAEKFNMSPQVVASAAVEGLFSGKTLIIPGFINKLNYLASVIFPAKILEKGAAQLYLKKEV